MGDSRRKLQNRQGQRALIEGAQGFPPQAFLQASCSGRRFCSQKHSYPVYLSSISEHPTWNGKLRPSALRYLFNHCTTWINTTLREFVLYRTALTFWKFSMLQECWVSCSNMDQYWGGKCCYTLNSEIFYMVQLDLDNTKSMQNPVQKVHR